MILPYYIALQASSCVFIYYLSFHHTITIDHTIFAREKLIARVDMIRILQRIHGTQLATQIFPIRICQQLVGVLTVVAKTIVQVVIDDTRSRAERNLSVVVRKEVNPVMMMMFRYRWVLLIRFVIFWVYFRGQIVS